MKRVVFTEPGEPDVFEVRDMPQGSPGSSEILIDLKATGVNWSEVMIRRGDWPVALEDGFVLGAEGAGIVEEVGDSVSTVRPGDRVAVFDVDAYLKPGQGTYASHIVIHENKALKIPSHLDFAQSAALPMALLTAYDAMVCHSPLPESGNIVVTACTGAVGIAAIQLARMKGLRVIGTTRDGSKADHIRQLGCDVVVGEAPSEVCEQITKRLGNAGVDYVFDPIQGPMAEALLDLVTWNGTYVVYGNLGGSKFQVSSDLIFSQHKIHGYVVLRNLVDTEELQSVWAEIYPLIEEKLIEISVAKTFPLSQAAEAHAAMEAHQYFGKLVITQ